MNTPLNSKGFYIQGFSSLCTRCTNDALKELNDYEAKSTQSCCRTAAGLALMSFFYGLSDHWKGLSAEEILNEVNTFAKLIDANPQALGEYDDLSDLLNSAASRNLKEDAHFWSHQISIGCTGQDHLYSDMGFTDRSEVSAIMQKYFPALAELNPNSKMKWKKFLYKQLCDRANIPTCPAPSCQQCVDYAECFHE
jgi:nitrogen fixation protein NifQ